jgi:predicted PurR-regulated permease PerM
MKELKTSSFVILAAIIIILAGIMASHSIIIPIILSLFVSIIFTQPILWLETKKIPYSLAMLIVLVTATLAFIVLGGIIGNSLGNFLQDVPKYEDTLRQTTLSTINRLNDLGANIDRDQILKMVDPGKILSFTAGAVGEIGNIMSDSFLIMFITIFMLLEVKTFMFKTELIEKIKGGSLQYMDKIGKSIRHYLSIKAAISLLTGILIYLWLVIVGVDYAILWGVIAFMLNFIPSIGSIVAAIPTMLLALVQLGFGGVLWTGIGYLAVNILIGNVVEPRLMGKGLGLSTLVVFLSLVVWGYVLGTVGMFLSIPLTISIKIMLEQREETRWAALLLGTEEESKQKLKELDSVKGD